GIGPRRSSQAQRAHVGPDLLDVPQALLPGALGALGPPAVGQVPVGPPDRVLLLVVEHHEIPVAHVVLLLHGRYGRAGSGTGRKSSISMPRPRPRASASTYRASAMSRAPSPNGEKITGLPVPAGRVAVPRSRPPRVAWTKSRVPVFS